MGKKNPSGAVTMTKPTPEAEKMLAEAPMAVGYGLDEKQPGTADLHDTGGVIFEPQKAVRALEALRAIKSTDGDLKQVAVNANAALVHLRDYLDKQEAKAKS